MAPQDPDAPDESLGPWSIPPRSAAARPREARREETTADAATAEAGRFRRPVRPAPSPGEGGPLAAGDPFAEAASLMPAAAPGAQGLSEPLAALAAAFQANADALRRSQETTAELGRALQRADRSEVMLQQTGALNETFRGLTSVQRSLLHRIGEQEASARSGRWFLPALVLAAVAVVGVGLWLVVRRLSEVERDVVGTGDVATQLAEGYERGVAQGRGAAAASFAVEREVLEGRVARAEKEARDLAADRDAKAQAVASAQAEAASLKGEVLSARGEALRVRALEEEIARLRAEAAVRDPEIERLKRDLAEEKRTVAGLRGRLAELGMGAVEAAAPEGAVAAREAPSAPTPSSAEPTPDRRSLDRSKQRLNELLEESGRGRSDYLQVMTIGGQRGDRLTDVRAVRYGSNGRVLNFVQARELAVVVDRSALRVEFRFADGSVDYGATSVPFPGGAFASLVADGAQTARWLGSGLSFVIAR